MNKLIISTGAILGSIVGGYIPIWWGASSFSVASILLSALGAIIGIWAGYRISKYLGLI